MTTTARPRSLLWGVYEHMAMVVGLVSLAVVCLSWSPLALVLYRLLPGPLGRWLGRQAIMRGFRLYVWVLRTLCACRFDLSALDALRDQGPMVIAANHPSLLDAVLITSRLPNAVCLMKASLMDNPLFGAGARMARYVRNDNLLGAVLSCRRELHQGAHGQHAQPAVALHRADRHPRRRAGADRDHRVLQSLPGQGLAAVAQAHVAADLPRAPGQAVRRTTRCTRLHHRA